MNHMRYKLSTGTTEEVGQTFDTRIVPKIHSNILKEQYVKLYRRPLRVLS